MAARFPEDAESATSTMTLPRADTVFNVHAQTFQPRSTALPVSQPRRRVNGRDKSADGINKSKPAESVFVTEKKTKESQMWKSMPDLGYKTDEQAMSDYYNKKRKIESRFLIQICMMDNPKDYDGYTLSYEMYDIVLEILQESFNNSLPSILRSSGPDNIFSIIVEDIHKVQIYHEWTLSRNEYLLFKGFIKGSTKTDAKVMKLSCDNLYLHHRNTQLFSDISDVYSSYTSVPGNLPMFTEREYMELRLDIPLTQHRSGFSDRQLEKIKTDISKLAPIQELDTEMEKMTIDNVTQLLISPSTTGLSSSPKIDPDSDENGDKTKTSDVTDQSAETALKEHFITDVESGSAETAPQCDITSEVQDHPIVQPRWEFDEEFGKDVGNLYADMTEASGRTKKRSEKLPKSEKKRETS